MAREIKREFDFASFHVVLHVADDFGNVSKHSISLVADKCIHCGTALPGTDGSPDVDATAKLVIARVDELMPSLIEKFKAAAKGDPVLLARIQEEESKRNASG